MLWMKNGSLLIDGSGNLIDCAICPCPGDGHATLCNGGIPVPGSLDFTFAFGPFDSVTVPLTWRASGACAGGASGWLYDGGFVEICSGFLLGDVSLCCYGAGHWELEVVTTIGGILAQFLFVEGGSPPLVVVDTDPIHMTAEANVSACGDLYDILIDIEPTPP